MHNRYYTGDSPKCDDKVYQLMIGTIESQAMNKEKTKILFHIKKTVEPENPLLNPYTPISDDKAKETSALWGKEETG